MRSYNQFLISASLLSLTGLRWVWFSEEEVMSHATRRKSIKIEHWDQNVMTFVNCFFTDQMSLNFQGPDEVLLEFLSVNS